ncbi:DUF7507 domain-containing protein [Actinomadura hibisca]|uniref:DUF7507 domain-containing protein n=1 Tax=Actinomadura hibisca TaxID=68565 RepID=UPI00082D04F1|nr:CARDB domain-containing protein [Actinomadura hibisca]
MLGKGPSSRRTATVLAPLVAAGLLAGAPAPLPAHAAPVQATLARTASVQAAPAQAAHAQAAHAQAAHAQTAHAQAVPARAASARAAVGTTVVDEPFTGAAVADPRWRTVGSACLTADTSAAGNVAACPSSGRVGPVPARGASPGYLQLTDARTYAGGGVVYNRPIPAAKGLNVSFDAFMYGGTGADGISFFLVDGATDLTNVGGRGGGLGYAPLISSVTTPPNTPGIAGGYLGVGLDSFGNYYRDAEGRGTGCPAGQRTVASTTVPETVSVRGPGAGMNGYCVLGATVTGNTAKPSSTLPGKLRAASLGTAKRTVDLQITPGATPRLTLSVDFGSGPVTVLRDMALPGAPSTYKFGFAASTGASTNVHLIRNLTVSTQLPLGTLTLTKQVSRAGDPLPAVIRAGTVIPYEYVLTNAGDTTLVDPAVTDPGADGPIACPSAPLHPAPDPSATLVCTGRHTVTGDEAAAGEVASTATATARVQEGGTVEATSPAALEVPLESSMAVAKSVVTSGPYKAGQQVSYSYTVRNTGGSVLKTVKVADDRATSAAPVCETDTLDPGQTTTCQGQGTIRVADLSSDGRLRSSVTATAVSAIGQDVTASTTSSTPVAADLAVTIAADEPSPAVGDTVTFTVTLTNNGPSASGPVTVTAPVSTSLANQSSQADAGSYNPGSRTWSVPGLAAGATARLTRTDRVVASGSFIATATIATVSQPDPNTADNSASTTLKADQPIADIAVLATAQDTAIRVGRTTVLTLTAKNNGPRAATGVAVRAPLPSALRLVSASGTGGYDGDTSLWTVGSLAPGQAVQIALTVRGADTGFALTTASLAATSPQDPAASNDVATAGVTVQPRRADLAVTIRLDQPGQPRVGDRITAVVETSNNGPDTAPDVRALADLPPGLTLDGYTVDQGTLDRDSGVWRIGALESGESVRLVARLTAAQSGFWSGSVSVSDPGVTDPVGINNSTTSTVQVENVPPPSTDVGIATVGPADLTVSSGGTVEYRVRASNRGPIIGTGVVYTVTVPQGLGVLEATASAGSFDAATGRWTLGDLAVGETPTLTLRLRAGTTTGSRTVVTALSHLDQADSNDQDNITSSSVTVTAAADLAVTKTVSPQVANVGELLTYTVTVSNRGPQDDTGVQLQETSRDPVEFLKIDISQGVFHPDTRTWDVGALAAGATATLTVKVPASPEGSPTNTTVVSGADIADPDLANNRASATVTVLAADLATTLTADRTRLGPADTAEVRATVTNKGPRPATGVVVRAALPGVRVLAASPGTGSYDAASRAWSVGDLAPGASAVLTLRVRLTDQRSATLAVTGTAAGPPDPEHGNDTARLTLTAEGAEQARRADLGAAVHVRRRTVRVGEPARVDVTATNRGPDAVSGAQVTIDVARGLRPALAPGCSITGHKIRCPLPRLARGASRRFTVTVVASSGGDQRVTARVGGGNVLDPVAANDRATAVQRVSGRPGSHCRVIGSARC